jgi:phosphoglycerate kinase
VKLLKDLDVKNKKVFVRADLDVPLTELVLPSSGLAADGLLSTEGATRIKNLKPTIDYLTEHDAKQIIIAGHIDRPDGPSPTKSTRQLISSLQEILGREVEFCEQLTVDSFTQDAKILLLENLRFWPGETANDVEFAKKLALLADIYVNEAFGNSHREHASMAILPKLLSHGAGFHLEKEIRELTNVLESPGHPLVVLIGGAKIETKIPVIENLAKIADKVLVGGELLKNFQTLHYAEASRSKQNSKFQVNVDKIVVGKLTDDGLDIDGQSIGEFEKIISGAKMIVWNGPMGFFEKGYSRGTLAVTNSIIGSGAYSIVGGGETTQFLASQDLLSKFSFVSSGGGAMLEFLSGKVLPGIKALE